MANNTFITTRALFPCQYFPNAEAVKVEQRNVLILGILSIISSLLSCIGSGSVIIYAAWKRICSNPEVKPLIHLAVADLMLALFWMAGALMEFTLTPKDQTRKVVFCFAWQAATECVHLISYFLTVNYAMAVYVNVKEKIDRITRFEYFFMEKPKEPFQKKLRSTTCYIVAWILPVFLFIPFGIMLRDDEIMACQKCIILLDVPKPNRMTSLLPYYGYIVLVLSLSLSIFLILTFYFLTLRWYRLALPCFCTDRQRMVIGNMTSRITLYILAFLYCWSPAFVIASTRIDLNRQNDDTTVLIVKYFGLYILQAISAPLQGFLNSIVYGWSRKAFREAIRIRPERKRLVSERYYFTYGAFDETPPSSLVASFDYKSCSDETISALHM